MNLTEFLKRIDFTPYSSVINSWDSFNQKGSVLMQLWLELGQRTRVHAVAGAYLRVCCWNSESLAKHGQNQTVGYNGRQKAIEAIEAGQRGYAALSNAPEEQRGPGVWAKNCDLEKVYPILAIERTRNSEDIFAILGAPISIAHIE
jgi:hypothetical protein